MVDKLSFHHNCLFCTSILAFDLSLCRCGSLFQIFSSLTRDFDEVKTVGIYSREKGS